MCLFSVPHQSTTSGSVQPADIYESLTTARPAATEWSRLRGFQRQVSVDSETNPENNLRCVEVPTVGYTPVLVLRLTFQYFLKYARVRNLKFTT